MPATLRIRRINCGNACLHNQQFRLCVENAAGTTQCRTVTICPNGVSRVIELSFSIEGKICFYKNGEEFEPAYETHASVSPLLAESRNNVKLLVDPDQVDNCVLRIFYTVIPSANLFALAIDFVTLSVSTLARYIGQFVSAFFRILLRRPPLADQDPDDQDPDDQDPDDPDLRASANEFLDQPGDQTPPEDSPPENDSP